MKLDAGRWVVADISTDPDRVVVWDCTPRPAPGQPCQVLESWTGKTVDGRTMVVVTAARLASPAHRVDSLTPSAGPWGVSGARARATDPDTSHAAAARAAADPAKLTGDQLLVLVAHWARAHTAHADGAPGLTDFELAASLNRQQTSVGKRRGELRNAGLIEPTGSTRPSPSGSPAKVWALTGPGRDLCARLNAVGWRP